MKKSKSFQKSLIKTLKDPVEAAEYINAVLKENDVDLLLVALQDVAKAHGGLAKLSRKAKLNRGNLYKMLHRNGHPYHRSIVNVLKAIGLRFAVVPVDPNMRILIKKAA